MPPPISLIGKGHAGIKEAILTAPKNQVFLVGDNQVEMLQSRSSNDQTLIIEYSGNIKDGAEFPPGIVIFDIDTGRMYLVDGIHRAKAFIMAGKEGFFVTIRIGTEVDALFAASGANASHGRRRSNKDKEHAAEQLVLNPKTSQYSNNRLAKEAKVSPQLIEKARQKLEKRLGNPNVNPSQRIGSRNGANYIHEVKKKVPEEPTSVQLVTTAVKKVAESIEKVLQSLPADLSDAFAFELKSMVGRRYSNSANKS